MADNPATSQFPKMGEHPLEGNIVNTSGDRSPYTMPVARKGPTGGAEPAEGGHRAGYQISEANGPQCRPMMTIDYPNAPEHSATGRGMRILPPKSGLGDFWDQRTDETGQVIH